MRPENDRRGLRWTRYELMLVHERASCRRDNRGIATLINRTPGEVDLALWAVAGRRPMREALLELNGVAA